MACSLKMRVYPRKKAAPESVCPTCGKHFHRPPSHRKRRAVVYCSPSCRSKSFADRCRKMAHLGRTGWTAETQARASAKMRGPLNPAWKGGVTLKRAKGNYYGVRYVRAPEWARPMARKDGYVAEHRLVMATMCGRLLDRREVVHHVNHDPSDNAPANLELWPSNGYHKAAEFGRVAPGAANPWRPRSSRAP